MTYETAAAWVGLIGGCVGLIAGVVNTWLNVKNSRRAENIERAGQQIKALQISSELIKRLHTDLELCDNKLQSANQLKEAGTQSNDVDDLLALRDHLVKYTASVHTGIYSVTYQPGDLTPEQLMVDMGSVSLALDNIERRLENFFTGKSLVDSSYDALKIKADNRTK